MVPDPFHIFPICNDAVFHRVFYFEQASKFLGLAADEEISFDCPCHNTRVFRSTDEGREKGFGGILAGEAGFDGAGTIVDHNRLVG